jgi:hypothetical protein
MMDIKKYTEKTMLEHICLTEEHLNDYQAIQKGDQRTIQKCAIALSQGQFGQCALEDASTFCLDCMAKHALTIAGLAKEGVRYIPEHREFYAEVAKVADELYDDLPDFDIKKADFYIDALRNSRKKRVASHLILGSSGTSAVHNEATSPPIHKSTHHHIS